MCHDNLTTARSGSPRHVYGGRRAHRAETETDRLGCQMARLEVDPITEDDRFDEGEPRLRTIPFNEFLDRMAVSPLCIYRTEAVQKPPKIAAVDAIARISVLLSRITRHLQFVAVPGMLLLERHTMRTRRPRSKRSVEIDVEPRI